MTKLKNEADAVVRRYSERAALINDDRYRMLNPSVWLAVLERQGALLKLLAAHNSRPLSDLRILEIGCGSGGNLLELLRMGCSASNLVGNELLPDRFSRSRFNLPQATQLYLGDALQLPFDQGSFDVVYQSTVFSSLLDSDFQSQLALKMWRWVRSDGAILWYDFTCDNPNNSGVKGVSLSRVRNLFPDGVIHSKRVTLAPPISRRLCRMHPSLYPIFNLFPFVRSHLLCWIQKP